MRLAVGVGARRGWSAREGRCGMGQEVVTCWRTVEKSIMRSVPPRHAHSRHRLEDKASGRMERNVEHA